MSMTDPLADMLTRIRNAQQAGIKELKLPSSKLKQEVARVLAEEGYIKDSSREDDGKQGILTINLKASEKARPVIVQIKRLSKPGLRRYVGKDSIPRVLNGMGVAIISTSVGVMTDKRARKLGVGGELLLSVY